MIRYVHWVVLLVAVVAGIGLAVVAPATAEDKPKTVTKAMNSYIGTVDGIDVIAGPTGVICYAFINKSPMDYIQVVTNEARLQSALELASAKRVEVEVSYEGDMPKKLTRVRLLDRGMTAKAKSKKAKTAK